ncbi:DnaB-like helicase C-terminal domain-containing protein [candidate division KSB1 bacterium]
MDIMSRRNILKLASVPLFAPTISFKGFNSKRKQKRQNKSALLNAKTVLEEHRCNKGKLKGIPTGYHELDKMISGFQRSNLIVIGGRPKMGKTAFGVNLVRKLGIENNITVGMFSFTLSKFDFTSKLLSCVSRINLQRIIEGKLNNVEWKKLNKFAEILSNSPVLLEDRSIFHHLDLGLTIKTWKNKYGVKLIIVNSLQSMILSDDLLEWQKGHFYITSHLKYLAEEYEIPIIVFSSLNSNPELRGGTRKPILSDFPDLNASIEQHADTIITLYRPIVYGIEEACYGKTENIAELNVMKQNTGTTGIIGLKYIQDYLVFEDLWKNRKFDFDKN